MTNYSHPALKEISNTRVIEVVITSIIKDNGKCWIAAAKNSHENHSLIIPRSTICESIQPKQCWLFEGYDYFKRCYGDIFIIESGVIVPPNTETIFEFIHSNFHLISSERFRPVLTNHLSEFINAIKNNNFLLIANLLSTNRSLAKAFLIFAQQKIDLERLRD